MRGRTQDLIFIIRKIGEKIIEKEKKVRIYFIDLERAFDNTKKICVEDTKNMN